MTGTAPSLWSRLFGPSRAERAEALTREMLGALRDERAALTAVLTKALDNAEAQTALTRAQYDLLTAPVGEAQVRLMTPAIEAQYERDRMAAATVPVTPAHTPISPERLLADLKKDFSSLSLQ